MNCDAPSMGYGDSCFFCKNDQPERGPSDDANEIPNDSGCYDDAIPNCDADLNQAGMECFFCKNDTEAAGEIDTGCSKEAPNCDANHNETGTLCYEVKCEYWEAVLMNAV